MTAETIPSPAPAPESSGAGAPAAAKRVPLTIKVCHAWSNHWSVEHLVHRRVVEVAEDGSDTLASVKDAFAEIEGVPVDMVMFMWMDRPIGRYYQGEMTEDAEEEESQTLEELGVMNWLRKFPHWTVTAAIVEDPPMDSLETVHRSVAVTVRGFKEGPKLDRWINVKKKKKEWNTLVYGAPKPWDDRYDSD